MALIRPGVIKQYEHETQAVVYLLRTWWNEHLPRRDFIPVKVNGWRSTSSVMFCAKL